jgi:hypothetical protein
MMGKQSLLPTAALAESQWAEAMSSTKLMAPGEEEEEFFFLLVFENLRKSVFFFSFSFRFLQNGLQQFIPHKNCSPS